MMSAKDELRAVVKLRGYWQRLSESQQEQLEMDFDACFAAAIVEARAPLVAALEPFADFWRDAISEMGSVANTRLTLEIGPRTKPRWSDFRRAAALKGETHEREG